MTNEQAKLILQAYRPGGQDAHDPLYAEALAQARCDPGLARWFEAEQSLDAAIGEKFREQPVPSHLESDILALATLRRPEPWWRRTSWMAAAALVALLALAALWWPGRRQGQLAAYRDNMTDFLNRRFDHLDFKARRVTELKQFLAQRGAPGDFALPAGLSELPGYGCRVLAWEGRTVSLICFHLADKKQIHLFVIQGPKFRDAPPAGSVQFASSSGWTTASWRQGDTTYLLAGKGGQAALQKHL